MNGVLILADANVDALLCSVLDTPILHVIQGPRDGGDGKSRKQFPLGSCGRVVLLFVKRCQVISAVIDNVPRPSI